MIKRHNIFSFKHGILDSVVKRPQLPLIGQQQGVIPEEGKRNNFFLNLQR